MNFPPEIFHFVLSQCDVRELQQFLEVSEDFRQMIIKTPRLMRKLKVIFFRSDWRDKIPFMEKYGQHVRSVKFDNCPMRNTNEIRRILSMAPNVEELDVAIYEEGDPENPEEPVVDDKNDIELSLNDLRSLDISANDSLTKSILNDLRNSTNIEQFSVETYFTTPVVEVGDFLSRQGKLKEISIRGNGSEDIGIKTVFTESLVNMKELKLRKLCNYSGLEYYKRFSDFLKAQSKNIEELDLRCYSIDFHYYRLIFKNFTNLKKISLTVNYVFNEQRSAELAECSLPSVTTFESDEHIEDSTALAAMMKAFPNLEVLSIPISNCPFHVIFDNMPKLKVLKANHFKLEMLMCAKSTSLRVIDASTCESMMLSYLWEKLAEGFPNLEKLLLKNVATNRFQKTTDTEIKLILMNLSRFKRLNHFELINDNEISSSFTSDHDHPAAQAIVPQNLLTFKFLLRKTFRGSFNLKHSSYFSERQGEALDQIKKDFEIAEALEEN